MRWWITVATLAMVCGCGHSSTSSNKDGGTQQDGPPPQADAATDGTITPDGGGPALRGHRGSATLSGAVQATSSRYRVIMSTGQSPGGNNTAASDQHKLRGGLVGATQGP